MSKPEFNLVGGTVIEAAEKASANANRLFSAVAQQLRDLGDSTAMEWFQGEDGQFDVEAAAQHFGVDLDGQS